MKAQILLLLILSLVFNCTNTVEYTETFKNETSGKYLYNPNEVIDVFYENDKLYLIWKGGTLEPVALKENEFFVADMYNKFHFVQHPETKERYLSILPEDENKISYDYLKVPKNYKTPSVYLEEGDYENALEGYLKIKAQDSTSVHLRERNFNSLGYQQIRNKNYEKAIGIFKLNAVLHPNSANVYDSLAEAYLHNSDSLQAYVNYEKTLKINSENKTARAYISAYNSKNK